MIAFVVILFFGVTGLTLNHPAWTFGDAVSTTTETATLPVAPVRADGSVDYLGISEFVRDTYGVRGHVDSFDTVAGTASIAYKNPGYGAEVVTYDTSSENDLVWGVGLGCHGVVQVLLERLSRVRPGRALVCAQGAPGRGALHGLRGRDERLEEHLALAPVVVLVLEDELQAPLGRGANACSPASSPAR